MIFLLKIYLYVPLLDKFTQQSNFAEAPSAR